ncbi:hypothetical protein ABIA38_002971 [Embleya sp. AB8]
MGCRDGVAGGRCGGSRGVRGGVPGGAARVDEGRGAGRAECGGAWARGGAGLGGMARCDAGRRSAGWRGVGAAWRRYGAGAARMMQRGVAWVRGAMGAARRECGTSTGTARARARGEWCSAGCAAAVQCGVAWARCGAARVRDGTARARHRHRRGRRARGAARAWHGTVRRDARGTARHGTAHVVRRARPGSAQHTPCARHSGTSAPRQPPYTQRPRPPCRTAPRPTRGADARRPGDTPLRAAPTHAGPPNTPSPRAIHARRPTRHPPPQSGPQAARRGTRGRPTGRLRRIRVAINRATVARRVCADRSAAEAAGKRGV